MRPGLKTFILISFLSLLPAASYAQMPTPTPTFTATYLPTCAYDFVCGNYDLPVTSVVGGGTALVVDHTASQYCIGGTKIIRGFTYYLTVLTGNLATQVNQLTLWHDANTNGVLDASDTMLRQMTSPDLSMSLSVTFAPITFTGPIGRFFMTVEFNTIASGTMSTRPIGILGSLIDSNPGPGSIALFTCASKTLYVAPAPSPTFTWTVIPVIFTPTVTYTTTRTMTRTVTRTPTITPTLFVTFTPTPTWTGTWWTFTSTPTPTVTLTWAYPSTLIDDMEDGNDRVVVQGGRNGLWKTFSDARETGSQWVTLSPRTSIWPPDVPTPAPAFVMSAPGYGSTGYAARVTGKMGPACGAPAYNTCPYAGFGFDFVDAGAGPRQTYDLSTFSWVQFYARNLTGSLATQWRVEVTDYYTSSVAEGGDCPSACGDRFGWRLGTPYGSQYTCSCYGDTSPSPIVNPTLTSSWQLYRIPLCLLVQNGWGHTPNSTDIPSCTGLSNQVNSGCLDLTRVFGMQWALDNASATQNFDFQVDQIEFFAGPAVNPASPTPAITNTIPPGVTLTFTPTFTNTGGTASPAFTRTHTPTPTPTPTTTWTGTWFTSTFTPTSTACTGVYAASYPFNTDGQCWKTLNDLGGTTLDWVASPPTGTTTGSLHAYLTFDAASQSGEIFYLDLSSNADMIGKVIRFRVWVAGSAKGTTWGGAVNPYMHGAAGTWKDNWTNIASFDGWNTYSVTGTLSDVDRIGVQIYMGAAGAGSGDIYIDDVTIEDVPAATPTRTSTHTPTFTYTGGTPPPPTFTHTPTHTFTITNTIPPGVTRTFTPTFTNTGGTASPTFTRTHTPTPTPSFTPTSTYTTTPSTGSGSSTITVTFTSTYTFTTTFTFTWTPTYSPTPTETCTSTPNSSLPTPTLTDTPVALPQQAAALAIVRAHPYPNPSADGKANLYFELSDPTANAQADGGRVYLDPEGTAELSLYTTSYRLMWRTTMKGLKTGDNHFAWDGKDAKGAVLSNGTYIYRVLVSSRSNVTEKYSYVVILR